MDDAELEAIMAGWTRGIRTERMPHNHINQVENGVAGCPACEAIEPYHMTDTYTFKAINQRAGGWA